MLTLKRSAMKYKDANGTMQDLGAVVGTQTPDAVLSETSTNCVQNKVVAAKIMELETVATGKADKEHVHSWNDLEDRPFYTKDPVETTLLNNVSVTISTDGGYTRTTESFTFKNDQTYKVTFDGTEYECASYPLMGAIVIGNGEFGGATGGNNEPFLCVGDHRLVYAATAGTHTITVIECYAEVVPLPEKFIPYKPGKVVEGTRWAESFNDYNMNYAIGDYSHAEGYNTTASGDYTHAEGEDTNASGNCSHAEGSDTTADGDYSHAEGASTTAEGAKSHAEGYETNALGASSHAEGQKSTAEGDCSHAEGYNTYASGMSSHAEGSCTKASSADQHVQGKYNVEDIAGTYAHIVGNGSNNSNRSNAHTVDWDGNAWFAGTVEGTALILKSSTAGSTKKFKITIDDDGVLSVTPL